MNEETANITEQEIKKKKALPIIIAAAVALIALIVGISIYNTPANHVQRQLDLGNKYLEEENYEQAAIAFEEAIAIDECCMDAYVGGLEAYLGAGNIDAAQDFYDRTLAMLSGLDEDFLAENIDNAVELYLSADKVYGDDRGKIAQVLEESYTVTGEDTQIKDKLIENYIEIGKKETQDGSYEEALTVYDRLLELDNTNPETISGLCECLNKYIDILMAAGEYDKIRELEKKYSEVAIEIDFSAFYIIDEEMEKENDWVDISPQVFDFKLLGFDLWENHAEEIWGTLLPLAQSEILSRSGSGYEFMMENRVYACYMGEYSRKQILTGEIGTEIRIEQFPGSDIEMYGEIEYDTYSDQIWLIWIGAYQLANGQMGTPTRLEKFLDSPIGETGSEWYSLINIEQIKEKGQEVKVENAEAWRFRTEWGDGYYYEMETNGSGQYRCALAIDCIEQEKVYSVYVCIEPDDCIDIIHVCVGKNYVWNWGLLEPSMDVFGIFEQ